MKRETVSSSRRAASQLELPALCQLCLQGSAGLWHPESSARAASPASVPAEVTGTTHSPLGRWQGAKWTSLPHNATAPLPYLPSDGTKVFCGQWAKNKPEQQFQKGNKPTESAWINTSTHPPFSIGMCLLFTCWEVQTGLRNGIYNCTTILFPCKHKNIVLRQPCAFAACYFKMSYALGWKILGMQW